MKKNALAVIALHFIIVPVFAQKNVAKVNLSALAVKSYSVQYERQIAKRFSVALNFSTIPKGGLPFPGYIDDLVDNPNVQVGSYQLGTTVFTPEVRFYVGKKGALQGFYLAPYARISTYNLEGPINYQSTLTRKQANFSGKLYNTTGGLMFGSQFRLSKHLYLDWWILGASIGSANGDLAANVQLDAYEQQQLKNVLNSLDIPLTNLQSTVTNSGATVTTTGTMVGVRGFGINLGIRF